MGDDINVQGAVIYADQRGSARLSDHELTPIPSSVSQGSTPRFVM